MLLVVRLMAGAMMALVAEKGGGSSLGFTWTFVCSLCGGMTLLRKWINI